VIPTSFAESNGVLDKPEDMDRAACEALAICRADQEGVPVIISCWKMSKEELDEVNKTGRVWLVLAGNTMAPAFLTGVSPFA